MKQAGEGHRSLSRIKTKRFAGSNRFSTWSNDIHSGIPRPGTSYDHNMMISAAFQRQPLLFKWSFTIFINLVTVLAIEFREISAKHKNKYTHRIQRYDPLYDDLISAWQLFSSSQTQRQPLLFKPSFTIFSDWMRTEQELQNFVISTFNCTSDWFVDIKIYIKRWEKRNVNMICSEYQNTSIIYSYIHTSVHF